MQSQSIKEYGQLETYYWWFVGRRNIIGRVLEKFFPGKNLTILDWGCGPGGNFVLLRQYGNVLGVDASDESLSACRQQGITQVVKASDPESLAGDTRYDLITNFDVLEHIADDAGFLRKMRALLKPGGYFLVTVPAYQFLWGGLDEVTGHKRRYTKHDLIALFEKCGFQIVRSSYFMFLLAPAFITYRMLEKLFHKKTTSLNDAAVPLPKPVNWLLTRIVLLEAYMIPQFNLPFGTSIILLARRQSYEKI